MFRLKSFAGYTTVVMMSLLLGAAGLCAESVEDKTFPLSAGGRFSLENVNGSVVMQAWDQPEVSIHAVKTGTGSELERMEIEITAKPDHVHVETLYKQSGWRSGGGSVDYEIKAPRGCLIQDIDVVNGSVTISGFKDRVEAASVNGSIKVEGLEGTVSLETVNGKIEAGFDRLGSGQSVAIESVNGAIQLWLPANADADLDVETINGGISNDFGLPVEKGTFVGSSLSGRLGSGGARVSLETVNGRVAVDRR